MTFESGPYVPTETLYQFCSVANFRNIIASRLIWYTDLDSANDPRELKLGPQKFIEALRFVVENEYEGHSRDSLLRVVKLEEERSPGGAQRFSACFSLLHDELPMWREYGDNYRGVAIGFCPATISSMPGMIQESILCKPRHDGGFSELGEADYGQVSSRHCRFGYGASVDVDHNSGETPHMGI